MTNESNSYYDKLTGYIRKAIDRFALFRDSGKREEPSEIETPLDRGEFTFYIQRGIKDTITFTPLSNIAYLDPDINRFRNAETGLILSGKEYRAMRDEWRGIFLGELLESRFPFLSEEAREDILKKIDDIRNSDMSAEEKDDAIRDIIGSP